MEEADLELGRLGVGEERALVRDEGGAQAGDPAVLDRQLAVHVVVAREPGRDQVSRAVLDPLHRPAEQERGRRGHDVAGVDRHLVAEAAADVGRDDTDVLLRQARHEGEQRPDRMRRLRGHVDRGLAGRRVDVRHAAAALERRRVAARIVRVERDDLVGLGEGAVGGLLVARFPVVDEVGVLPLLVVADHGGVALERPLRRRDGRQRLVLDVDQLQRVLGDVGGLGHDRRHLLALEAHLVGGEHRLGVAREGGHPGEVVLRHQVAGDDGDDTRQGLRPGGVDRDDAGVCKGAAQELHVQHPRERDVVDVVALAADEALVLLALDRVPEPANLRGRHHDLPSFACAAAAWCTALTMFW